jgi:RNA polymerase sigma-70 factor, ECF subfamily
VSAVENTSMKTDGPIAEPDVEVAVKAVRAGDVDVFSVIVEKFQDSIMTIAMAMMKDRHRAEELTQNVFVRAYERLSLFDAGRPMKPWLAKITYRLAHDMWRSQSVRARHRQGDLDNQDRADFTADPLESLIAGESARALWRAVETLPLAERTAAILYYREGLTVDDVAESTGVSAGSVKSLLFRARNHLRIQLSKPEKQI